MWRQRHRRHNRIAADEVQVTELVAETAEGYIALWRYLLSIDRTRTVVTEFSAIDEPLWWLVNEPRALNAATADALWVRLVNVPEALAARQYSAEVDLVLEVTDNLVPQNAGRWRLTANRDGAAQCSATAEAPDLTCDVADLGAAYLGGTPISTLAGAGRIRELRPGAIRSAARAFTWAFAPSTIDVF